jgi:hypothetical protein
MKTSLGILTITACLGLQIQAQTSFTNGLVAYYPFNGNANDASGNGHHATLNTSTVLISDRFGIANAAYHFQGAKMQFTNIAVNLAGPCSFGLWMRLNGYDEGNVIAELNATDFQCNGNPLISQYNASVGWSRCGGLGSGTNALFGLASGLMNSWHHLFVTVSGGVTRTYLDGQAATNTLESFPATTLASLTLGTAGNLQAGVQNSRVDLDDIRMYNRALSGPEVQQLYAYESSPRVNLIKAVKPSFSNLILTTNYQLQVSGDLSTWTNTGSAFTATNSSMVYPQYWDVDNWDKLFFRLQTAP